MFLSGDLAFYFGFASEFKSLRERNPNLNFDVTVIPQSSGTSINSVYGKMHILSVVKNSQKVAAAFNAIQILNSKENSELLSQTTNLPSVRRDLLVNVPNSNIGQNINTSSLISKVFLDPDTNKTKGIFSDMIEGYVSGRMSLSQAISNIDTQINLLLK
jgi:ABC-type glycerol-3-phosphate transport system substrate-binding protein